MTRVALGSARPRDLCRLLQALQRLPTLRSAVEGLPAAALAAQ
jgi:DNA mismatch repair ATPase MutS